MEEVEGLDSVVAALVQKFHALQQAAITPMAGGPAPGIGNINMNAFRFALLDLSVYVKERLYDSEAVKRDRRSTVFRVAQQIVPQFA